MPELILTADDHPHITRLVELTFRQVGCEVVMCSNGKSAWETLQQVQPDLIITDYDMPGMTGVELCRLIRNDQGLKEIPIVLLTARGLNLPTEDLIAELNIAALISKPFSPRALRETGLSLIRQSQLQD